MLFHFFSREMCHKTEKLQLNRQYHRTANRLIYRKSNRSSLQFADSYIKVVFQSFILSGRVGKLSFIVTAVFQYFVKSPQRHLQRLILLEPLRDLFVLNSYLQVFYHPHYQENREYGIDSLANTSTEHRRYQSVSL